MKTFQQRFPLSDILIKPFPDAPGAVQSFSEEGEWGIVERTVDIAAGLAVQQSRLVEESDFTEEDGNQSDPMIVHDRRRRNRSGEFRQRPVEQHGIAVGNILHQKPGEFQVVRSKMLITDHGRSDLVQFDIDHFRIGKDHKGSLSAVFVFEFPVCFQRPGDFVRHPDVVMIGKHDEIT